MSEPEDKFKHSPHDQFVFQQFSQPLNILSVLQNTISPGFDRLVNWPQLSLYQSRFVDPQLRSHFSDLVYRAEWLKDGEPCFFYFLFEHKSSIDHKVPLQLLTGMVSIWQEFVRDRVASGQGLKLPFVYPLVLYHGERGWTVKPQFAEMVWLPEELKEELSSLIPHFEHRLLDLHQLGMEEIRGTVKVRMILSLLKAVGEGKEKEWFETVFYPLAPIAGQKDAAGFLMELLTYLARSSGQMEPSTFKQMIDRIPDKRTKAEIMTLAEKIYAEGEQQGLQKGQNKGHLWGKQEAVISVLEARFGVIPSDVEQKIKRLDSEEGLTKAVRLAATSVSISDFIVHFP